MSLPFSLFLTNHLHSKHIFLDNPLLSHYPCITYPLPSSPTLSVSFFLTNYLHSQHIFLANPLLSHYPCLTYPLPFSPTLSIANIFQPCVFPSHSFSPTISIHNISFSLYLSFLTIPVSPTISLSHHVFPLSISPNHVSSLLTLSRQLSPFTTYLSH